MARPSLRLGSPVPASVFSPSTKSTDSAGERKWNVLQAIWLGDTYTLGESGEKLDSICAEKFSGYHIIEKPHTGTHVLIVREGCKAFMRDAWANAVEPRPLIDSTRSDESRLKEDNQQSRQGACIANIQRSFVLPYFDQALARGNSGSRKWNEPVYRPYLTWLLCLLKRECEFLYQIDDYAGVWIDAPDRQSTRNGLRSERTAESDLLPCISGAVLMVNGEETSLVNVWVICHGKRRVVG
jgi:hypothetical protein